MIGLVHALPLEAPGAVERTLSWVASALTAAGAEVETCLARDAKAVDRLAQRADLLIIGELRPGPDLMLAAALAVHPVRKVLFNFGYGFCAIGTRVCGRCPLAGVCLRSDRVQIYRRLTASADLIVYLSPLHREMSEHFVESHPERTLLVVPRLEACANDEVSGAAAVVHPNDPGEFHAVMQWARAHPDTSVRVHAARPFGEVPENVELVSPSGLEERFALIDGAHTFLGLAERPIPFGDAIARRILSGRRVEFSPHAGISSYGIDRRTRPERLRGLEVETQRALVSAILDLDSTQVPVGPAPDIRSALVWAHDLGMGDSIILLPFLGALAHRLGPDRLTVALPARHRALIGDQVDATMVDHESFDVDARRDAFDVVFEICIDVDRFHPADIVDGRWVHLQLARQPNAYQSAHENLLSFLGRAGITGPQQRPKITSRDDEREAAYRRLMAAGIDPHEDLIVSLHPGAGARVKCWPAERFAALARLLEEELGAKIVLIEGLGETDLTSTFLEGARADLVAADDSARSVGALMSWSTLHVGNDSGLTHLASAVGAPVVGVFGPSYATRWGPTHNLSAVVQALDEAGQPTGRLSSLPTESVFVALLSLLLRCAFERPSNAQRVVALVDVEPDEDGSWTTLATRIRTDGVPTGIDTVAALLVAAIAPTRYDDLAWTFSDELVEFAVVTGLLGPAWARRLGAAARAFEVVK